MPSAHSQLGLLQLIADNVHHEPCKAGPITEDDLYALQIFRGKITPMGIIGIRYAAADALIQLADAIFTASPYRRGTTFNAVKDKLIENVIFKYAGEPHKVATSDDLAQLIKSIEDWLKEQIASCEFYIPCLISPWYGPSFSIGPIRFLHIRDFQVVSRNDIGAMFDITFSPFLEMMQHFAGHWIATVNVEGCTKDRAQEIANLAVDIALAGFQLCLPEDGARHMARMTGRTMPVFGQAVSSVDGTLSTSITNSEPGRLLGPTLLQNRILEATVLLDSVGNRIGAYLSGNSHLTNLEMAWSDAAYWYHEGLAEPLDTIAVPKLETTVEILLRAENSRGSKARMLKAIEAFYGKKAADLINGQSGITVEKFAEGLVTDRSRILHGTWSTLTHSLRASRPSLETLVRELLALYSLGLDEYAVSMSPGDDVDNFLNFVGARPKVP